MTNAAEIAAAVETARANGAAGVCLLHCVSAYPARYEDANLRTVGRLAADFDCVSGLSDHTSGTAAAVAAVALGACVIEKHVTLRRADGGPDAAFSLEPDELRRLVEDCRAAWSALGVAGYARSAEETANKQFRRSLYVVRDVPSGRSLTAADVRSIRPGYGMAPARCPRCSAAWRRARSGAASLWPKRCWPEPSGAQHDPKLLGQLVAAVRLIQNRQPLADHLPRAEFGDVARSEQHLQLGPQPARLHRQLRPVHPAGHHDVGEQDVEPVRTVEMSERSRASRATTTR
jgi:hypothetical protein